MPRVLKGGPGFIGSIRLITGVSVPGKPDSNPHRRPHVKTYCYCGANEPRTLAALRDALLPKLLSGELRVPAALHKLEANA